MSLINQMLQDLEQRDVSSDGLEPASNKMRTASRNGQYPLTKPMILLVVIILACVALWLVTHRDRLESPPGGVPTSLSEQVRLNADRNLAALQFDSGAKLVSDRASISRPSEGASQRAGIDLRWASSLRERSPAESPSLAMGHPDNSYVGESSELVPMTTEQFSFENQIEHIGGFAEIVPKSKPLPFGSVAVGKVTSVKQHSENFYREALTLLQQGRTDEAVAALSKSLQLGSYNHKARQALVGLLIDQKQTNEAIAWLNEGMEQFPSKTDFRMALARLQVDLGGSKTALKTLENGLSYVEEDANYHAFYAALLQRDGQHRETIRHYLIALRSNPAMSTWLVGLGISLQANGQVDEAGQNYQRALETRELTPNLARFVHSRLQQMNL